MPSPVLCSWSPMAQRVQRPMTWLQANVMRHFKVSRASGACASVAIPSRVSSRPVSTSTRAKVDPLDFSTLQACQRELQQHWVPAKVERSVLADPHTLALGVRTIDRSGWILVSWHPVAARVCVGPQPERGEASSLYPIAQQARSRLQDQVLIRCSMPIPFERLVRLDFGPHPDEPAEVSLLCEVQGQYSNVIMVDGDSDTVILAARQIGKKQTAARSIKVGAPYMNPPQAPGLVPTDSKDQATWMSNVMNTIAHTVSKSDGQAQTVAEALSRTYQGVSRRLARELCSKAGLGPDVASDDMESEAWQALHQQWLLWLEICEDSSRLFTATRSSDTGAISVLGTFEDPCESVQQAVGSLYATAQATERFDQLRATLQRAVKNAHKRLKGKITALEKQKDAAVEAEATQKLADMFMANVYQWPKSALEMEVADWDTGESILLVIKDENLGPVQYAEKLYKKAAKHRRAVDQLQPLLDEATSQLEYVADVEDNILQLDRMDDIQDLRALQEVQDEMVEQGLMKAPADAEMAMRSKARAKKQQLKRKRSPAAGGSDSPYRVFESPSGYQILIGRNHAQNDALSTRIAQDEDVWMHARQHPGSHLVMRIPAGSSPNTEDIQYAANLSVFFSKARTSGKCDVTMCCGKDVRKPKGAKPGQVLVQSEKVVTGYPQKSAAALLASTTG